MTDKQNESDILEDVSQTNEDNQIEINGEGNVKELMDPITIEVKYNGKVSEDILNGY